MNNSTLAIGSIKIQEERVDIKSVLREREQKFVHTIEAIQRIAETQEWCTLKTEIFDGLVTRLEKALREESKKEDPSSNKLNRLAGQLQWADKFSDLSKLETSYRIELRNVRLQLYGKE